VKLAILGAFLSGRSFSYAGLVSSTYQSGGMVRHGGITKEGSRWLRWIMIQCVSAHVRTCDSWITRSYNCLLVGGVRILLGWRLLGSCLWFVIRCLRISGRFMINLELFHRVELFFGCGRVVD
jgi:transposase